MKLTEDRKALFLKELSEHGVAAQAARMASPHSGEGAYETFRDERAAAWAEAVEHANAALEMEIHRRGYEETRTDSKGRITVLYRYSDACLLAMARARLATYRKSDVAVEHDVKRDTPLAEAVKEVAARLAGEMRTVGQRELDGLLN